MILNMANAKTPGGGWRNGAGAQEESLFRRTDYLHSLIDPQRLGSGKRYPIAEFGGIYSPGVLAFRSNENTGYGFLPAPEPYSFVASAAINRPRLVHAGHGKKRLEPRDASKTKRKIAAVLSIGLDHGHDSIVLSAFGCGAFQNPPEHIAEIFKELLVADPGSAYSSTGTAGRRGGTWHTAFEGCYKRCAVQLSVNHPVRLIKLGACVLKTRVVFAILDDANTGHSHNTNGNLAPFVQQFGQPVALAAIGDQPSPATAPERTAPMAAAGSSRDTSKAGLLDGPTGLGGAADQHACNGAQPPVIEPAAATIAALRSAKKWSAGLVPYRSNQKGEAEVLVGHMGGPFWKTKQRAWSILKGEPEGNEQPVDAFAVAVSRNLRSFGASEPLFSLLLCCLMPR